MSLFAQELYLALDEGGDITIKTRDERSFQAHSVFLQFAPVLRAELSGPMREAREKIVNMDCEYEVARSFVEFLYIGADFGHLFSSLDHFVEIVRLADFYGLMDKLAKVVAASDIQDMFLALVTSSLKDASDPTQHFFSITKLLLPLLDVAQHLARIFLTKLPLKFGCNAFRCLCHLEALGLKGGSEHVMTQFKASMDAEVEFEADWISNEINENTVTTMLDAFADRYAIVLYSLATFASIVGSVEMMTSSTPRVGAKVIVKRCDGTKHLGTVTQVHPNRKFVFVNVSGTQELLQESEVMPCGPYRRDKLFEVMELAKNLVRTREISEPPSKRARTSQ